MNAYSTTTSMMQRFHRLLGVLVLSMFSLQVLAVEAPVVVNVDHRVKVSFSKVRFDARKGIYSTRVRINNQSGATLFSPLRLSINQDALKTKAVRLLNAKGTGKDGQPYFEFALPRERLAAGRMTKSIRVDYVVEKVRQKRAAKRISPRAVRSLFASAYHVSAGVELALLTPSANPYALPANAGKKTVRFSVPVLVGGGNKSPTTVYLRRKGDKESIAMNDLGEDGDFIARDGIHGVNVQINTGKVKPDSCLRYEIYIKQGRARHISRPLRLCVSSLPVGIAKSDISTPAIFPKGTKAVADEVLISVTPKTSAAAIRELASSINASVVGTILPLNFYQLKLSSPSSANGLLETVAQLKARKGVVNASINAIGHGALDVDDTAFDLLPTDENSQHGLKLVLEHNEATNANAWDAGGSGSGVTVVVLDTGLESSHSDLDATWTCQNASLPVVLVPCTDTAVGTTVAGHGTQVTGVIAARANNSLGVAGVAFGSSIHSVKMGSYTNAGMVASFQAAAGYVGMNGNAKIVNASFNVLDGFSNMDSLCGAIESVVSSAGVPRAIVVNAAGNQGLNGYSYPAKCKDSNVNLVSKDLLITVSNSASFVHSNCGNIGVDQRCAAAIPADPNQNGSNFGSWVDIAAPGSVIRTTTIGNTYASSTGTSFSTPIVSGAAAILASCGMPLGQIRASLRNSANVAVPYPAYGAYLAGTTPRLDIHRALSYQVPTAIGLSPSNSISENNAPGATVATLTATDPDICDQFTFASVVGTGSADNGSFMITGNQLTINGIADFEIKPSYSIRVRVTDFGGLSFDQPLTVNVINLNDPPTTVVLSSMVLSTPENGGNTKVADIAVTDDALGTNVLALSGADAASFNIVGTELYFNGGANFEVKSSYNVTVEVDDASVGATPDATQGFALTITDVNDLPTGLPVIQPPAAIGTRTVGQTITADTGAIADEDGLGAFSYQWRRGVTDIAGATASTYVLVAADVGEFMSLCVSYTDGGGTPESLCSVADAVAVGDPHITTIDGLHYDFQSAGEFVALRDANGMELQLRMTAVSTATPLTDPNSGLTSGVSINTALAARVGNHRVTYQPDISPNAASGAPVLRVDGVLTTPLPEGLDLGTGGRVISMGNGIQIDFPDGTTMIVSSSLWSYYNVWWLHISVFHTPAQEGIMGARSKGSWLPKLSDGSALGAMPAALHDRYVELYVKFADSWRVTDSASLFDYAEGTSTATFTNKAWPTENGPYVVDSGPVAKPLGRKAALRACRQVKGKNEKADCVFDVRVMGQKAIAKPHLLAQKIRTGATFINVRDDRLRNKRIVTFTATVAPHAALARRLNKDKVTKGKGVPTGWVQFTLNGKKAGRPVKLNSKGQARWKVSRRKVDKQTVGARYIPAKRSIFLRSRSLGTARLIVDARKTDLRKMDVKK